MNGNDSIPKTNGRGGRYGPRALLLASVVVLALALAASCGAQSGGGGGRQPAGSDAPAAEEQALGRETLGEADAPVVLTEYADYQ